MIIVTGCARSYTSLTMRIMEGLGAPVAGQRYINKDALGQYNPDGMYEVEETVCFGTRTDKYKHQIIKLVLGALFPNRYNNQRGTAASLLKQSKAIFCLRKPIEIAYSSTKLMYKNQLSVAYPLYELSGFIGWLSCNRWFVDNLYTFNTERFFTETEKTVRSLAAFIGFQDETKIRHAMTLVRPKKKTPKLEWPDAEKAVGAFVDNLYSAILNNDFEAAFKINNERLGI